MKDVNNSTTNWTYEIQLYEDIHDDGGPAPGDCFGAGCDDPVKTTDDGEVVEGDGFSQNDLVKLTAVVAGIGVVFLALSIQNERKENDQEKHYTTAFEEE